MMIQDTMKALIEQTADLSPLKKLNQTQHISDEVLLESDFQGVSYYLVRRRQSQSSLHLSPQETKIAKLVAQGLSNKLIAKQLEITHWTVATHLRRVFVKMSVNSRAEMIAKLSAENLL